MNPVFRFLLKVLLLYIVWFVVYELWLHPQGIIDNWVVSNLLFFSSKVLAVFGFSILTGVRSIVVNEISGLQIGDACNGINIIALYMGFIIAFPGEIKNKIFFLIFGAITIHFLNVLRIIFLSLLQLYRPEALAFNHTYTFTFLIYCYIFLLWIFWVNKFSKNKVS